MQYNRAEIMCTAWRKLRHSCLTFPQALRMAWMEAKEKLPIFTVVGYRIHDNSTHIVCQGCTYAKALEQRHTYQCHYDRIEIEEPI